MKLKEMNFLPHYSEEGLKVYTYLQLDMQKNARLAIKNGIENLEQHNKKINALKKQGEVLQGLLIHIDLESGGIVSLVGGKDFRVSQFNRAVDSRRQVGSIFKPLVYLSALESQTPSGKPYSPLTMISDEPFIYKYEGQTWQPQNYEKKFNGIIPMYYALKNSINVATARLGVNIGLEHIIDVARRMGMHSEILPVPALTLGAFEMQPFEVAKIYSGIARMGSVPDLNIINKIKSHSGDLLYESELNDKLQVSPEKVAQLVGMLKQTLNSGTARLAKRLGFNKVAAGKTGTTSDTKDAWFVGFTPKDLTITWVGYDNNISSELTGASGALPIWVDYMKKSTSFYEDQDFNWPPGVQKKVITLEENLDWLKDPNADEKLPFELIVE